MKQTKSTKSKYMSTKTRLKKLYAFRDKLREAMLGEEDPEYRDLLQRYYDKATEEIKICLDRIENNLP